MRHLGTLIVLAAIGALPAVGAYAHGSGASGGSSMPGISGASRPEDLAKAAYNSGVRDIKKAGDSEADAAKAATPEKSAKASDKAHGYYQKAVQEFIEAVGQLPGMYQAWNYLGFANRHLGNYDDALSAYAKALELNPNFPDALEYRGEAYLGLNKIEPAKEAYMSLFRDSRKLADELMLAMRRWTESRRKDAQGVAPEDIEAFAHWVDERSSVAAQTASLAIGAPLTAWPRR
jgi:tetratricopeptide (TPR) repeat protein